VIFDSSPRGQLGVASAGLASAYLRGVRTAPWPNVAKSGGPWSQTVQCITPLTWGEGT
jgi:hypothetical protein